MNTFGAEPWTLEETSSCTGCSYCKDFNDACRDASGCIGMFTCSVATVATADGMIEAPALGTEASEHVASETGDDVVIACALACPDDVAD